MNEELPPAAKEMQERFRPLIRELVILRAIRDGTCVDVDREIDNIIAACLKHRQLSGNPG